MSTLAGKTALVTGVASGIGRASAILFAQEGATVFALDRAPEVVATVATIRGAGGRATALVKDSSSEDDVAAAVASRCATAAASTSASPTPGSAAASCRSSSSLSSCGIRS